VSALQRWASRIAPAVLVTAAVWGALPVGVPLADAPPSYYTAQWSVWAWGSLVALGVAALLLVLTRGAVVARIAALWRRQLEGVSGRRFAAALALALAAPALLACGDRKSRV
jgi:hypothetical protein